MVVQWPDNTNSENRIFSDVDNDTVGRILDWAMRYQVEETELMNDLGSRLSLPGFNRTVLETSLDDPLKSANVRNALGKLAASKKYAWFKRTDLAESVGKIVAESIHKVPCSELYKGMRSIENCDISRMSKALELLSKERCFLEAPAGCGKTHTIAEAVGIQEDGVQLVLTHTHAGVHSLQQKLNGLRVPRTKYRLDTIAGWSLRIANYYPKTASFLKRFPDNSADYDLIYRGVAELLQHMFMKKIIRLSYAGIIVDEYQDCTLLQHKLILALSVIRPCRILGDPLQGIFRFGDQSQFLNWDEHVRGSFDEIPMLDHPFRWADKNMPLGRWLLAMRNEIKEGNPIDLPCSIIQHVRQQPQAPFQQNLILSTRTCGGVANRPGTAVAIHPRNESATHCPAWQRKRAEFHNLVLITMSPPFAWTASQRRSSQC